MAIENGLREILLSGTANRQTIIHFPNGEYPDITSGFYSGSLKLEEILCASENLTFGECNASKFEATISNLPDISNLIIYVYQRVPFDESKIKVLVDYSNREIITHDGNSILVGRHADYILPLFYGRVDSAKLKTDRTYREIIAYDELYFQGDTNCADWYSTFFSDETIKTLKDFRDSLFVFIGIEQEDTTLPNDSMIVEETLSTTSLKFSDIIKAICQINGCFGQIDRNGVFRYIFLNNTVDSYDISDNYRSNDTTFESYNVKKIDKLQISGEEGDIGAIVGIGDNPYVIQGNFLVWGKGANDLTTIATNIFNVIKDIEYRPISAQIIYSEPYIKVGTALTLTTQRDGTVINTYVLQNSFDSVQLFHQTITSTGNEYRDEVVDDVNAEINQLKGKTLKLTKNVEEFSVEMTNISGKVDNLTTAYSLIKQQSDSIVLEVGEITQDLSNKVDIGKVSSQLSIEKDQITISGNRLVIDTDNFQLSADGKMICTNGEFKNGIVEITNGSRNNTYFSVTLTNGSSLRIEGDEIKGYNSSGTQDLSLSHSDLQLYSAMGTAIYADQYISLTDESSNEYFYLRKEYMNCWPNDYYKKFEIDFSNRNLNAEQYTINAFQFNQSSDSRLKKDFTIIDDKFMKFYLSLEPLLFKYINSDNDKFSNGFIAQDILEKLTSAGIDSDEHSLINIDSRGYYSLNYNYIYNLTVLMVQELYKKLEAVENEIKQ